MAKIVDDLGLNIDTLGLVQSRYCCSHDHVHDLLIHPECLVVVF